MPILHKLIQKIRKGGNRPQLIPWDQCNPVNRARQRHHEKENDGPTPHEHRHCNPQQNTNKISPAMY